MIDFVTEKGCWKLNVKDGRQWWIYDKSTRPQSFIDKYWLGLLSKEPFYFDIEKDKLDDLVVKNALEKGFSFFSQLQTEDGHWAGDYGGPLFLLPGMIFALYISKQALKDEQRHEIIRYMRNCEVNGGGWGL